MYPLSAGRQFQVEFGLPDDGWLNPIVQAESDLASVRSEDRRRAVKSDRRSGGYLVSYDRALIYPGVARDRLEAMNDVVEVINSGRWRSAKKIAELEVPTLTFVRARTRRHLPLSLDEFTARLKIVVEVREIYSPRVEPERILPFAVVGGRAEFQTAQICI